MQENKVKAIMSKIVPRILDRGTVPEYPTGLFKVDDILWGFKREETCVIAGRTSMGKTAISMQFAWHLSVEKNFKIAFFSLEMGKEYLAERLLAMATQIDNEKLQRGGSTPEDIDKIQALLDTLADPELYIHDAYGFRWEDIETYIQKKHPDIIFVDYVQMIKPKPGMQEREVYGEYMRSAKFLAKKYNMPIVINSQINRMAVEGKVEDVPRLHHLKGSGTLEENTDSVMIVHWNWKAGAVKKDGTEYPRDEYIVYVAKNRNGRTGIARISFIPEYYRFVG